MASIEKRLFCTRGLFCFWLLVLCAMQMHGQSSSTGEIRGTVTDSSGAVLVGAQVAVVNVATGERRISFTNKEGLYDTGLYTERALYGDDYRTWL